MTIKGIPIHDVISVAVGIIGLLTALAVRKNRLPKWAVSWLNKIGTDRVMDAITTAAAYAELSPAERQAKAVEYVQALTERELGLTVPTSIAKLLVEFVYQQYKKRTGQ